MANKIIVVLIFLASLFLAAASQVHADCYNEDSCFKDYVTKDSKDTVVAVNRDTNNVELYWSEKDNTWLKPEDAHRVELQKLYDRKLQLREMQRRMDRFSSSTLYTTDQSTTRR